MVGRARSPAGQSRRPGHRVTVSFVQSSDTSTKSNVTQTGRYYYEEDYFDTSPKTDYTYVRSGAYSREYLGADYVIPNLSRLPLHASPPSHTTTINSSSMSRTTENSQSLSSSRYSNTHDSSASQSSQLWQSSSTTVQKDALSTSSPVTRSASKTNRISLLSASMLQGRSRKNVTRAMEFGEDDEEEMSNSASTSHILSTTLNTSSTSQMNLASSRNTRSNQSINRSSTDHFYGETSRSNQSINRSSTDHLYGETSRSNQSINRSSIDHLYGLDQTDTEYSESESATLTRTSSAISESNTSVVGYAASYIYSQFLYKFVNSFICNGLCRNIICAPVYWAISKVTVFDVWLLSRTRAYRRRWGLLLLLLLFLIPWLLAGTWISHKNGSLYIPVLFGATKENYASKQENKAAFLTGFALEEKIRQIFLNLDVYQSIKQDIHNIIVQQQTLSTQSLTKLEVEEISERILQGKLEALLSSVDKRRKDDLNVQSLELQDLEKRLVMLQQELEAIKATEEARQLKSTSYIAGLESEIGNIKWSIARLEQNQLIFGGLVKNCCKNATDLAILIQDQVSAALVKLMSTDTMAGAAYSSGKNGGFDGHRGDDSGFGGMNIISFGDWLHHKFVSKDDMDAQLAAVTNQVMGVVLNQTAASRQKESEKKADERAYPRVNIMNGTGLSEIEVQSIVQRALNVFMADKTGMVDYALESAGGCVLSTRCTEEYDRSTALYHVFGFPIYYQSQSPRTIIQPDVHPGNCWPFKGSEGYIVIQLSQTVIPTSFSLEHIPKSLAPTGEIDSAPKDFSVWGLQGENDQNGLDLGNYSYSADGPPIQFFTLKNTFVKPIPIVELRIKSNHGNKDYTCIYRFRVHGTINYKWT